MNGIKHKSKISSDSSFHEYLINKIRLNNNHFVLKFDNFLFAKENFYPQLYHWLLSFSKNSNTYFWNTVLKILLLCFITFLKYLYSINS